MNDLETTQVSHCVIIIIIVAVAVAAVVGKTFPSFYSLFCGRKAVFSESGISIPSLGVCAQLPWPNDDVAMWIWIGLASNS